MGTAISILRQIGLSRHLYFLTYGHSDAQSDNYHNIMLIVIGWVSCIVAQPTKILDGRRPTLYSVLHNELAASSAESVADHGCFQHRCQKSVYGKSYSVYNTIFGIKNKPVGKLAVALL